MGKNKFIEMKNKNMVEDVKEIERIKPYDSLCEACVKGKQCRLPYNEFKDKTYVKRPLYIVHSDVCGPITPSTVDNKSYFVFFVDEYTHYCVTYLISYKSEVYNVFRDFIAKSETRFNLKIVYFYTYNGGEYLSKEMKDLLIEKGISYHLTVPRSPQLNGVAERMVRNITEKARAMLAGTSLDKAFWGEAVLTATYLINITPTNALKKAMTPFELWHEKKPKIKYLRIFGSTVYIHNKTRKSKFEDKTIKGILVGYVPNAYKVWVVETGKFVIARDVIVDEKNFLKTRPESVINENTQSKTDEEKSVDNIKADEQKSVDKIKADEQKSVEKRKADEQKSVEKRKADERKSVGNENEMITELNEMGEKTHKIVRKEDQEKCKTSQNDLHENCEIRRSDRIKENKRISYNEDDIPENYILTAQSLICKVPNTFAEIKENENRKQWEEAVKEEINSLILNNTWTLVSKPEDKNIVNCKWVFAIKNDSAGNPIRYKARLVAKGFSQRYLDDYNETFAPVARFASLRLILAFSNQNDLLLHHMDVKTAFLNGKLKEEIYMAVPEGIKHESSQVCKLNKSLYGLKQAARCWYEAFDTVLKEEGFISSKVDPCIYILDRGSIEKNIYVVLYVDDLVIATADIITMNNFKSYLKSQFSMVDLNEIKLFLGVKITRSKGVITLDQSAYIRNVLTKYNMIDCKPVSTPLETKLDYEALNCDKHYDAPCRNVIGCLMYVMTCTRPDLSAAINILSRFTNKNNEELWKCLKRLLRYLKGTMELKLTYTKINFKEFLVAYADWGSDTIDRKSTTGFILKLFDECTVCWGTKKQLSVAASSTEAEYMALYETVKEVLWVKSLLSTIQIEIPLPIKIYEDNMGCITIANNAINHKRTKHISIKYHLIRDEIEKKIIKLVFLSTDHQLADVFTKPIHAPRLSTMRMMMGLK